MLFGRGCFGPPREQFAILGAVAGFDFVVNAQNRLARPAVDLAGIVQAPLARLPDQELAAAGVVTKLRAEALRQAAAVANVRAQKPGKGVFRLWVRQEGIVLQSGPHRRRAGRQARRGIPRGRKRGGVRNMCHKGHYGLSCGYSARVWFDLEAKSSLSDGLNRNRPPFFSKFWTFLDFFGLLRKYFFCGGETAEKSAKSANAGRAAGQRRGDRRGRILCSTRGCGRGPLHLRVVFGLPGLDWRSRQGLAVKDGSRNTRVMSGRERGKRQIFACLYTARILEGEAFRIPPSCFRLIAYAVPKYGAAY